MDTWYKSYHINFYVKRFQRTKTNTEISFSFWLTLFYSIPLLALTHRLTDWRTDRETTTLALRGLEEPVHASRGLEEPFFQLCCCVSFWFWRKIGFGCTYYYVLGVPYSCGVVLFFFGKKRYSRLSGGCAMIITTGKKRYSHLSLVAIVIFVLVQLELNLIQIR